MKEHKNKSKLIYSNKKKFHEISPNDKPLYKYLEIDINKKQNTYIVKNDPNHPKIKGKFKWYKKLQAWRRLDFWSFVALTILICVAIIICCVFFIH